MGRSVVERAWWLLVVVLGWLPLGSPPGFAEEENGKARVRVQVVHEDGTAVPGARYVAAVRQGRSWRRPEREAVVQDGAEAPLWSVPPGSYRVICDGEGVARSYQDRAVDLQAGDLVEMACVVHPTQELGGRVVAASTGRAVAGARVGIANEFLEFSPRRVSAMARSFGRSERVVTTDEEGEFRLPLILGWRWALWIEAPGFRPRAFPGFLFPEGDTLGSVALESAGGLTLAVELPADFPVERYKIHLEGPAEHETGERRIPDVFWQRALDPSGRQRWLSLPPGEYDLLLKGQGSAQVSPVHLGAATVWPNEITEVGATLPGAVATAAASGGENLILRTPIDPGTWVRVHRRMDDAVEAVVVQAQRDRQGTFLTVPGCQPGESLFLETEERVSRPFRVRSRDCRPSEAADREVRWAPKALLRGRWQPPQGEQTPEMGEVRVSLCGDRDDPRRLARGLGVYFFPTEASDEAEARWQVAVPAACLELKVAAPGYAPRRFEARTLEAGTREDLGAVPLVAGAALLARVVSSSGSPWPEIRVEVVPGDQASAVVRASYLDRAIPEFPAGWTDERGWVTISGLPEGEVLLRLGVAELRPRFFGPVELRAGVETVLDEVVVAEGGTVAVTVALPEGGSPGVESVVVLARGHASCGWLQDARIRGEGEDGRVVLEDLAPGRWHVEARARLRSGALLPLGGEEVEVAAGGLREVVLGGRRSAYGGRVVWQGEPLAAFLDFEWLDTDRRDRIRVRSDEEGRFDILLQEPGLYRVRVESLPTEAGGEEQSPRAAPEIVTELPAVRVEAGEEIELELPETRLEGRVVDREGRPVPGAAVSAHSRREAPPPAQEEAAAARRPSTLRASTRADARGVFLLPALAAGAWQVEARTRDGALRSEPRTVRLEPQEVHGGMELVVAPVESLEVHLHHASGGALAQAPTQVAIPASSPAGEDRIRWVRSDERGRLGPWPWRGARSANLVVLAPAAPISTFRVLRGDSGELHLPSAAGNVRLSLPDDGAALGDLALRRADGSFVGLRFLERFAGDRARLRSGGAGEPAELSIQGLASGEWQLIRPRDAVAWRALLRHAGPLPAESFHVVDHLQVRPGEETRIRLP